MFGVWQSPGASGSKVCCCVNFASIITCWAIGRNRGQTHHYLVAGLRRINLRNLFVRDLIATIDKTNC